MPHTMPGIRAGIIGEGYLSTGGILADVTLIDEGLILLSEKLAISSTGGFRDHVLHRKLTRRSAEIRRRLPDVKGIRMILTPSICHA